MSSPLPLRRTVFLASLLLAAGSAVADTIQLAPDRDNTLFERPAGDLSNGSGTGLFFGRTGANAGELLRRTLIRFDLSSIPPGSTVNSVELTLQVDLVPPTATGFDASIHRVDADWGEGASVALGAGGGGAPAVAPDATWLHREFDTVLWTSPGGDFQAVPSGLAAVGAGTGPITFPSSPGLLADVQAWVDDPSQNFGWVILGEETNPQNARRVGSRENTALAPVLTVDFEPLLLPEARAVPALGGWGIVLLVLAVLALAALASSLRIRPA
ncbi:hypothetical protein HFP89_03885 [Wenzhouxiangella sp. XN79A]|uniref:hypothetical protein n=1 Tax=Wenzhouxiangella sp. XN79A TaxID=2724193 RepID=UPI00144A691D|nr:hypothetical protein [Wenzhouxiangella sp. XN79A]NKI34299.1 hypothetical protein [Wenzhouxiangella sp. XN79A]